MSRRRVVVKGARFGSFVVLMTPAPGERHASVQCQNCGHEEPRAWINGLGRLRVVGSKSCIKCRWTVCTKKVKCRVCRVEIVRPRMARGSICQKCKRVRLNKRIATKRSVTRGRVCASCARSDAEVSFMTLRECVSCHRAAVRNGRCSCGKPVRRTRACSCGAPAQKTPEEATRPARQVARERRRERAGAPAQKTPAEATRPARQVARERRRERAGARRRCERQPDGSLAVVRVPTNCFMQCGALARPKSIYCSDKCRAKRSDQRRQLRRRAARAEIRRKTAHDVPSWAVGGGPT